jgi:hypothetical protein
MMSAGPLMVGPPMTLNPAYAQNVSVTWRDRFGCIWWRGRTQASYQCPSDPRPIDLPITLTGLGFPSIFELPDGTIGIPSYGRMMIGRPGGFKVFNGANGCPNAIIAVAGKDDSVWVTSTSGLYVLPLHAKLEFWSARDGLKGTVWSVLHAGNNVFATADISSEILDSDRSHWRVLPTPGGRLFRGPQATVMAVNDQVIWQMDAAGKPLRHSPKLPVWLMAKAPDASDWVAGNGIYRLTPSGDSLRLNRKLLINFIYKESTSTQRATFGPAPRLGSAISTKPGGTPFQPRMDCFKTNVPR